MRCLALLAAETLVAVWSFPLSPVLPSAVSCPVNERPMTRNGLVSCGCVPVVAMADIATINDIHSAYIHGSVPTAKGESDDIMALNFPDEVRLGRGCVGRFRIHVTCVREGEGEGWGRAAGGVRGR